LVEVEVDYDLLIIIVGYSKDIGQPAKKQHAPVPAKVLKYSFFVECTVACCRIFSHTQMVLCTLCL